MNMDNEINDKRIVKHIYTDYQLFLRDQIAIQAMQQPVSYKPVNFYNWLKWFFGYNYKGCQRPHHENAIQAYELADMMLLKREEKASQLDGKPSNLKTK